MIINDYHLEKNTLILICSKKHFDGDKLHGVLFTTIVNVIKRCAIFPSSKSFCCK